ncbi:putative flagellar protein FlaG [Paenibacillus alvei DSM 29]|nr:putative flagellar protein FlaG [Paenibacillus alvei DSM 29]
MTDKCNEALSVNQTHIQVKIHEKTNTIMVMVIRNDTEEVIREIPSEKILDMMYNICIRAGVFLMKECRRCQKNAKHRWTNSDKRFVFEHGY